MPSTLERNQSWLCQGPVAACQGPEDVPGGDLVCLGRSSALARLPLQAVLIVRTERRLILVLIMQISLDGKLRSEVIITLFSRVGNSPFRKSFLHNHELFLPLGFFQVKKR
uniref:Uncharacterized protein n=1 Tax=Otus sunia TaxID=257818 RepID=A0A8C8E7E3_9STRI